MIHNSFVYKRAELNTDEISGWLVAFCTCSSENSPLVSECGRKFLVLTTCPIAHIPTPGSFCVYKQWWLVSTSPNEMETVSFPRPFSASQISRYLVQPKGKDNAW